MGKENLKTLIVYGTRHGATQGTSEEIAKILQKENFEVKIVNAGEEKIKDISEYDLVAVGSGIVCGRWVNEAEDLLKRFKGDLGTKKLALFVSSVDTIAEKEGRKDVVAKARKISLEDKVSKYGLKPISMGFFGGVIDFNKMGFLTRKGMEAAFKAPLQKHGFKQTGPGAYDLRDWDEIRSWAWELAKKLEISRT